MDEGGVSRGFAIFVGWFAVVVGAVLVAATVHRSGVVGLDGKLYIAFGAGLVGTATLTRETWRHLRGRRSEVRGRAQG